MDKFENFIDKRRITNNTRNVKQPLKKNTIFTIGYEGLKIDEFINKLTANAINILVDVRKNPISRKKGFSKRKFSEFLKNEGIEYLHLPDLGIESIHRKNLNKKKPETYRQLFEYYDNRILPENEKTISLIKDLIHSNNVVLTCYEKDFAECHRSRITKKITKDTSLDYIVKHIY